jgi:hypothetical protein
MSASFLCYLLLGALIMSLASEVGVRADAKANVIAATNLHSIFISLGFTWSVWINLRNPRYSVTFQHDHRIDFSCFSRRDPAGQQRDNRQQHGNGSQRRRVAWVDFE